MLNQQKLRVLYVENYPAVSNRCAEFPALAVTLRCPFPGLMVEILNLIANALNIKIEPVTIGQLEHNATNFNNSIMRSMNYAFNLVKQEKVDTLAMGVHETEGRAANFSFSTELYREQTRFIMLHNLNIYNSIWSFFLIFDSNTWLTILLALIIQCSLCVLIRKTEFHMNSNNSVGILESFWQMLRLQLLQPETVHFKTKAGKVSIICFSLIQCTVLFGVFSSWILSNILSAGHTRPINSLEQLLGKLSRNEYTLVTHSMSHWFFEKIAESKEFPYAELRSIVKNNPIKLTISSKQTVNELINDRAVTFVEEDSETYFNSIGHCGIVEFSHDVPIVSQHLIFKKNSSFLNDVNRVIEENLMLIIKIKRKYLGDLKERHRRNVCAKPYKPIGIMPYLGLVIVCVSIFLFATLILLCEIGIARKFGSQNNIVDDGIKEPDNVQKQSKFKSATKLGFTRRKIGNTIKTKYCKRCKAKFLFDNTPHSKQIIVE